MINQAFIMGNLTRDPDLRYAPSGTAFCSFTVAINSKYKGRDGQYVDEVDYIDVTAFGRQGEACGERLKKGSRVVVQGKLKQERWDGEDGKKHSKVKIIASLVQFADGKGGGAAEEGGQ
jgi:single-strand DNA-binding protein